MKQGLYANECFLAENQSTEINLKAYREELFLIVSLKTVFEILNLVKSYDKTKPNAFPIWFMRKIRMGLNFFWPVYFDFALL